MSLLYLLKTIEALQISIRIVIYRVNNLDGWKGEKNWFFTISFPVWAQNLIKKQSNITNPNQAFLQSQCYMVKHI